MMHLILWSTIKSQFSFSVHIWSKDIYKEVYFDILDGDIKGWLFTAGLSSKAIEKSQKWVSIEDNFSLMATVVENSFSYEKWKLVFLVEQSDANVILNLFHGDKN